MKPCPQSITLHFVVLSFDRYSRDDIIGEVFCALSSVDLTNKDNHQQLITKNILPRSLKVSPESFSEDRRILMHLLSDQRNSWLVGSLTDFDLTLILLLQIRSQGRGEILVSLCWQPAANRLTVVILKARNLPKMDVTGLAGALNIARPNLVLFRPKLSKCLNAIFFLHQTLT